MSSAEGFVGQSLAGYQLHRALGRGGLGAVYLATATSLDNAERSTEPQASGPVVALKVFDLAGADGLVLRQAFRRESVASQRLSHPGIVPVHDAGEAGTFAYLAMQYMPGGDLTQHLAQLRAMATAMPWVEAASLGARLAEALAHAHGHGVVHRDVKPANVLLEAGPATAKLSDFGLARLADLQRSRTGVLAGTPHYMAPEQLAETAVDARTDLYSLGVVLFEMLAGCLPYRAGSLGELLRQVGSDAPAPPLGHYRHDAPPGLSSLVARLLSKRRDERPSGALAVAHELQSVSLNAAPDGRA